MLRLQGYERLLKAVVSDSNFSGELRKSEEGVSSRREAKQAVTLGMAVRAFLGDTLTTVPQDPDAWDKADLDLPENAFNFRFRIRLPPEAFARTEKALLELVALRNRLVHSFINEHDMTLVEGCLSARVALQDALQSVDLHMNDLRSWERTLVDARASLASYMQTEEFWSGLNADPPSAS